jgi:hypothetical protein
MADTEIFMKELSLQPSNQSMGEDPGPRSFWLTMIKTVRSLMCNELSEKYKVYLAHDGEDGLQ